MAMTYSHDMKLLNITIGHIAFEDSQVDMAIKRSY